MKNNNNNNTKSDSTMYRCCLGLLLISHVHTDGSHPVKLTWSVCDLLIDRGFDLARGYRFRVVAS